MESNESNDEIIEMQRAFSNKIIPILSINKILDNSIVINITDNEIQINDEKETIYFMMDKHSETEETEVIII